mmetsp:Transcript_56015/g.133718  ORF Transcript_56015/g.133718 Transcript_56015/m.133718 type:complete len:203 (+) Transcript_56015:310-918(+)
MPSVRQGRVARVRGVRGSAHVAPLPHLPLRLQGADAPRVAARPRTPRSCLEGASEAGYSGVQRGSVGGWEERAALLSPARAGVRAAAGAAGIRASHSRRRGRADGGRSLQVHKRRMGRATGRRRGRGGGGGPALGGGGPMRAPGRRCRLVGVPGDEGGGLAEQPAAGRCSRGGGRGGGRGSCGCVPAVEPCGVPPEALLRRA